MLGCFWLRKPGLASVVFLASLLVFYLGLLFIINVGTAESTRFLLLGILVVT